ncbi:MAG: 2-oxo-4-hydroxy-4-carboxy-5-ureidoimidazoline decarboxylase [Microbacterium sp.]
MEIGEFNAQDAADARALALVWAAIPRWADGIVVRRPYSSVDDLAEVAARLARTWSGRDLDTALAHHPRIGERPTGAGAEAAASRSEQAAMSAAGDDVTARMAAGNRAYEDRFGRVFLIRAAGRSPEEMLDALETRLRNDDAAEADEALTQLAEIALLRLRDAIDETTHARMTA